MHQRRGRESEYKSQLRAHCWISQQRKGVFLSSINAPEISATKNENDMPIMIIKRCDRDSWEDMVDNEQELKRSCWGRRDVSGDEK